MGASDAMNSDEAHDAAWAAGRGALVGAAKWGAAAALLGAAAYKWSPLYRQTTIQFKVYVQMSGMVFGGMVEADWRLRQFEQQVRLQRRWQREKAKWDRYEEELLSKHGK